MNRQFNKRIGALISVLIFISTVSFSQIDNVNFLRAGATDGLKIFEAYITPWTNAFGAGMNGGWYNTAKPHKFSGFDFTTSLNVGVVPSSAETFDLSEIGLSSFSGLGSTSTIAGPDAAGPMLTASAGGVTLTSFRMPPGTNWKMIPVPTFQVGIGLPLGTEIKGRFIPKISLGGGDVSLWGIGLLHSLMQYVPGDELLPFDVSLFGGYTKLQGNEPLSLQPDRLAPMNYVTYDPITSFQDQMLNATVSSMNVGLIGSLNLPVLTVYGGLGYSKSKTAIELFGNYPLPTVNLAISTSEGVYEDAGVMREFPAIEIENFSGLRANIGLRVKLAIITIHADYTRAQYNVFSTGLGVTFR